MWERQFEVEPGKGWTLGMLRIGDHGVALAHVEGHEEIWDWQVTHGEFLAGERNEDVGKAFGKETLTAALAAAAYGVVEKTLPKPRKGGGRCTGSDGAVRIDHLLDAEAAPPPGAGFAFRCRQCGRCWSLTREGTGQTVSWKPEELPGMVKG